MSRLVQLSQHANDLERAAGFYQDLLGCAPAAKFDPPVLLFFLMGNIRLLLEQGATLSSPEAIWVCAAAAKIDCDKT